MKAQLMRAVISDKKRTDKLTDRILSFSKMLGFLMRVPRSNGGKVQVAVALLTASKHVLDTTNHSPAQKDEFFRSFQTASFLTDTLRRPPPGTGVIN